LIAAGAFVGCSKEDPRMPSGSISDCQNIALEFTKALAARDYSKAYAMTSQSYRKRNTPERMQAAFEAIVPADWGPMGPIQVGQTMESWPGKRPEDLGWVYVSIGGDTYSEAIIVIVSWENGKALIREVEFGRP
jgi:hypothetical protein